MNLKEKIKDFLLDVRRPGRYIGGESGQIIKDFSKFRVGLCYPDLYDIGMGNLSIRLLYDLINRNDDFWAERVFAPWSDFEEKLRERKLPLYTLESFTPLYDLDVLGFTLPYEMVYTNVLNVLDLGNIPLYSKDRNQNDPIVIGGGPVMSNPEPLADFFDLFFYGEAEQGIIEILEVIQEEKNNQKERSEILNKLNSIKGVYIPTLIKLSYDNTNFYLKDNPLKKVEKVSISDFNQGFVPTKFPIPWTKIVHDKGSLEIMRGCFHRCRFCQAGSYYKPVREREPSLIQEGVREIFKNQGQREFSLMSLSSGDYSCLFELLEELNGEWSENYVSFYLPSLKINSFNLEVLSKLNEVRKSGLTLAIEAGSEETRKYINKEVSDEKLFNMIEKAESLGWKLIKIYLMIGLTDQIEKEKEELIVFIDKLTKMSKKMRFNISINQFIPKPFTPFQKQILYPAEKVKNLMNEIKKYFIKIKRVKIRYQETSMAYIEGILARGNRVFSHLIEKAFQKGARFDGWHECFDFDLWMEVINQQLEVPALIFNKELNDQKILPWDLFKGGSSLEFCDSEAELASNYQTSQGCAEDCSSFCGACSSEVKNQKAKNKFSSQNKIEKIFGISKDYYGTVGLVYEKTGVFLYLSQLELMNWWQKILTCAEVPLIFSEGYNPRPRLELGFTPAVGMPAFYENLRFQTGYVEDIDEIKERIEKQNKYLKITKIKLYDKRPKSLQSTIKYQEIRLKKAFFNEEKLLFFINESMEQVNETNEWVDFLFPIEYKLKNLGDHFPINHIIRTRLLDKDKKEVI